MLVLTRKRGEFVTLRDRETKQVLARVVLVQTKGEASRLGFIAPGNVDIIRDELLTPEDAAQIAAFDERELSP